MPRGVVSLATSDSVRREDRVFGWQSRVKRRPRHSRVCWNVLHRPEVQHAIHELDAEGPAYAWAHGPEVLCLGVPTELELRMVLPVAGGPGMGSTKEAVCEVIEELLQFQRVSLHFSADQDATARGLSDRQVDSVGNGSQIAPARLKAHVLHSPPVLQHEGRGRGELADAFSEENAPSSPMPEDLQDLLAAFGVERRGEERALDVPVAVD